MNGMFSTEERVDMLREAQQQLLEAAATIRDACHDLPSWGRIHSYLVAPIEIAASADSEWMSRDLNLDEVIEEIEEMGECEDSEDDEEDEGQE